MGNVLALALLFVLPALSARADQLDMSFLNPSGPPNRAAVSGGVAPIRSGADSSGQYGEKDLSANASFRVYEQRSAKPDPSFWAVSVSPKFDQKYLQGLGSVGRDTTIDTAGAGASAFHLSESGELYMGTVAISVSGDFTQSGAGVVVPTVFGMGTHHFSKTTALLYGVAFSTALGVFLPFPIIGIVSQLSPEWSIMTVLVVTQATYHPARDWWFTGFLRGSGYETEIANDGAFAGRDPNILLRSRAIEPGLGAIYAISRQISASAEINALVGRKLTFSDSSGTIVEQEIDSLPLAFQAGMTFGFD